MKMEIHDEHPTEVNDLESKNNILQPASDEADDETQMDNTQSEDEKENNDEDDEDDEIRRNYILEHADYGNAPSLPRIVSGFRENPNMPPFDPNFMQEPMSFSGFPMPQPYGPSFVESRPPTGETRSVIKRGRKKSHKKSNCPDSHHLDRVLVLPQHHCCGGCCDTVHTGCCGNDYCCNGVSNCGCCGSDCCCNGHRNCGYQNSLCDVHHWPVGCHEYYSHESPCLTYPSTQRVRYGYPTNGCGCGCGTAPYHSHHPVILHPTYQECNHHNIHTIGTNCQTPCHVTTPCHQTHIHHRINHVHHVYPHRCQNTCGCNTGCNCLRNADIQILPHYGHTSGCGCGGCGCHGWNPYWGY